MARRTGSAPTRSGKCSGPGRPYSLANQTVLISEQGEHRNIADSCAPIISAEGRVVGAVLVFRDITQQIRADAALQEAQIKYRILVEESLIGVYIIQDGLLAYINPRMAIMHGYDVEDCSKIIGRPVTDFLTPKARPRLKKNQQDA